MEDENPVDSYYCCNTRITCVLIDVVLLAYRIDRHNAATLSSTFVLTYISMTYVRGTILDVPQLLDIQHVILSFINPSSTRKLVNRTPISPEHPKCLSISHTHSPTYYLKNAINAINKHNGPRHNQTIRNPLAHALPPRHNRQLHLQRSDRPRNNRLPNLGPAKRHLPMAKLLPQLRLHNPTHLRPSPPKRRRLPLQHLRLPRPRIARQGIRPARWRAGW
jgi:hypothetical protein